MSYAHVVHGLILRILKELPGAEICFRRAYELGPNNADTLLELVRCLGEQGKHAEALPFARDAVNVEPENAACLANLAMTLLLTGQKEEARGYIEKALEIDPHDPINRQVYSNFEE